MKIDALGLVVALLTVSVAAWPSPGPGDVDAEVRQILAGPRYRFCHDASYGLRRDERDWCSLVDEGDPRCPSFGASCRATHNRDAPSRAEGCAASPSRPDEDGPAHGSGPDREDDPSQSRTWTLSFGPTASAIARAIFWGLLAFFVGHVVYAIVKNLRRNGDSERDDQVPAEASLPAFEAKPTSTSVIETDVSRLLARARARAAAGEFALAIADVHAALMRRLEGDGLVEIHPSRTNGEYVRALQVRPEIQEPVREIVAEVESVQFGARPASREGFQAIYDRVLPLVGRSLLFCVLAGLLPTLSCTVRPGSDRPALPTGHEALVELLEKHGGVFDAETVLPKQLHGSKTLLLLDTDLEPGEWAEVVSWAKRDGGVVVAAGRSLSSLPEPGVKLFRTQEPLGSELAATSDLLTSVSRLRSPFAGTVLVLEGDEMFHLLERDQQAHAAYRRWGAKADAEERRGSDLENENERGPEDEPQAIAQSPEHQPLSGSLLAFADARLFENVALASGQNAYFLTSLFSELPSSIVLWTASSGRGASNPLESIHRAHLTPVVLQLLALLVALLLAKGVAFGKLREPPRKTSRRFSDHVRALGLAYARANASGHVIGLYAAWALERLRERAKLTGRTGLSPIAESLALRTGQNETEVMKVLMEAHGAREESVASSTNAAVTTIQGEAARSHGPSAAADFELMRELDAYLSATADSNTNEKDQGKKAHGEP